MGWLILWIMSLVGLIGAGLVGRLDFWTLVGGVVWLGVVTFLLIYFWLAPSNHFFTFVKEGTAKFIVRGDKFEKCLIQWEGWTFVYDKAHPDKWNVIKGDEKHFFGGLRFYGLWPLFDAYIYKFRWSGITEEGNVQRREEWLDYVLLKDDVYWCKVDKCEDKNLLPLEIELLLTIRVKNPYKACFAIQNWLETVINRTKPFIRTHITQKSYDEWIGTRKALGKELMRKLYLVKLLKEFDDSYGIEVKRVEVKEINPPEGYREKTLAPYLAELDKKAVIIQAEGERQAAITKAEGERKRIETVFEGIQHFGDLGRLVRALEAVEKSSLAASLTVQAIPGLQEMLRGVFGKEPEAVTRREFQELREMIEGILKKES